MIANRRGKNVAILGGIAHLVFTGVMLAVWLLTGSLSALMATLTLAGGLGVWVVSAILFYCRQLERREAIELEEITADGAETQTIFESSEAEDVRPAAARLASMDRWLPPILTLAWCAYLAVVAVLMLRHLGGRGPVEMTRMATGMLLTVLGGFAAFLMSWYAVGMGSRPQWRLLRASGSYLLVSVVFAAAALVALFAAIQDYPNVDRIIALVMGGLQLVLAAELLVTQVMDFYRPRIVGRERRYSFDSRLCGLLAEPQRVGHSIAETLNYQFGFEVSKTWFYRLVAKAFVPLVVFSALVLVGMSSIVIVRDGERGVVMRWGRLDIERPLLEPGPHLKWPWPVETARRFSIARVHTFYLGLSEAPEDAEPVDDKAPKLWTKAHKHGTRDEQNFLLAAKRKQTAGGSKGVVRDKPPAPVDIIKLVALVQYVVEDPQCYGFKFHNVESLIEDVANRAMVRYCASATLTEPAGSPDRPEAIMTRGRGKAAAELKERIQQALDAPEVDVGVKVTDVTFMAVHPPPEAAEAFEAILEARHQKTRMRYEAEAYANQTLARMAGSPAEALDLAMKIRVYEELKALAGRKDERTNRLTQVEALIFRVTDDIEKLTGEIDSEARLGKKDVFRIAFREKHREHLALLKQTRDAVAGTGPAVDLAVRRDTALKEANEALDGLQGQAAAMIVAAGARRWQLEISERSRLASFWKELPAYEASPNLYMLDRWLDMLDRVLPNMVKYVIAVDPDRVEVRLNLEQQTDTTAGLHSGQEPSPK